MAVSAIRKASLAALLMLGAATIPAHAGWFDLGSNAKAEAKPAGKANAKEAVQAGTTLEDSIQEARMLRLAGSYPEAIKTLSQLMMVASDDPHVISEYGKTLASMGRASDAVNFLTRAQQLEPGDWTIYSALGVAYDQIGDQKSAQTNYEQALRIKPDEPSVLSNYALSRMLAKDPDTARKLAARAETAGGVRDAVIGRNITMIRSLAPETPVPQAQVAQAPAPAAHAPAPVASNVQPPVTPAAQSENRVVMQKVPVDPLAGPVQAPKPIHAEVASAAPRPLQPKPAEALAPALVKAAEVKPASANATAPVKAADAKPVQPALLAKTATPTPVKTAEVKTASAAPAATNAIALVKAVEVKPAPANATAPVKAADAKPVQPALLAKTAMPTPVKTAEVKPASAMPAATNAIAPVKAADAKPVQPAPLAKTATLAPVKAAEVKPASVAPVTANATAPVKSADAKPVQPAPLAKTATPAPVKSADAKPASVAPVTANATAPVKSAEAKPVQPALIAKTATPAPVKAAEVKLAPATAKATAPVKAAEADKPAVSVSMKLTAPVKAAEAAKPEAPKVLASAPVKAADGKPVVKTVGQSKNAIPGLRLSANAY